MKVPIIRPGVVRNAARILLVILGWATSLAAITLVGIFNGLLLPKGLGGLLPDVLGGSELGPLLLYLAMCGTSILASLLIRNLGVAFGSFLASYCGSGIITYFVLYLPALLGSYSSPEVLTEVSIRFTFFALFPFPLLAGLLGTILGGIIAEMRGFCVV